MLNANKEKLQSFFQNNIQYEIPFFQRSYVWGQESWEMLWEHLAHEVEEYKNGTQSEHFIGTIITKQKKSMNLGENIVELIDGQQRLTTISILLKAFETTALGELPNLKSFIKGLLEFQNVRGENYFRIEHSKNDAPYFKAIMGDANLEKLPNPNNNILKAFEFFCAKTKNLTDLDRNTFLEVLLHKVPVISMLLGVNDDEQEIFDTINSLGVRLTTGELLKNHVFKDKQLQPLYDQYWQEVFEQDDTQITFWAKNKTAGRIVRTNMEVLLYCYLIIESGKEVKMERLFKEYKNWLKDSTHQEKVSFLENLRQYAAIYNNFPDGKELNEIAFKEVEKRLFLTIEQLEISTMYPLILYFYKEIKDEGERLKALQLLESYLVRRNICKLTTKNYNKLVIQLLNDLKEVETLTSAVVATIFLNFKDDTKRYPSDSEVRAAFYNKVYTNKNARAILFMIALQDADSPYNDILKISIHSYSVEHMLPKKWFTHWNRPKLNEAAIKVRDQKLKTIGNLTLITKRLNSKLKNGGWTAKRNTLLEYSKLPMTTQYIQLSNWNEGEIEKRATALVTQALKIWTINVPVSSQIVEE